MLTYDEWKKLYIACRELTVASTFLLTMADGPEDDIRDLYVRAIMLYNAAVEFNNLYIEQKGDQKDVQEG